MTLAAGVLTLVGCGGGGSSASAPSVAARTTSGVVVEKRPCRKRTKAVVRAEARLKRDVRAIRRAAAQPTKDTLKGNRAVNVAVDRFLLDQGSLPLDAFTRNRFINQAAAASVSVCQQCFQALEANRPITRGSLDQPGALPCPAGEP